MGIPGLMSYIMKRDYKFLKTFELHDTYLVMDGNCIMHQLCISNTSHFCYGGDYDEYACFVSQFFDDLSQCKVTPLIIWDGAMEDKKFDTICNRSKQRILSASISTPSNDQPMLPVLAKDVFKYIVKQRNIKSVQSIFEADDHIASVARILNCPVLSFDSDFFIYNVLYIPYTTLESGISSNVIGSGFIINCKIFKNEYFLKNFDGMDKNVLPLAAVLFGNDYLSTNLFNDFFSTLKISRSFKQRNSYKVHQRIEALFRWLQHYTLNNAISTVVRKLDSEKRQSIIEVIEIIMNGYLNPSSEMLGHLGYSQEQIHTLMQAVSCELYKFDYVDTYKISEGSKLEDETDLSSDEDVPNVYQSAECLILKPGSENNVIHTIPSWFKDKYHTTVFPAYFMDMIIRQLIVASEQMEDFSEPACVNISLKIINIIFRLLNNGVTNSKTLKYITRGKGANIETYELDCAKYELSFEIPTLQQLINVPFPKRKEILNNTLGVDDKLIMEFPPMWRLYIAAIKYWMEEAKSDFTTKYHVYTLVLFMIHHVLKKVIREQSYFENININKNNNQSWRKKEEVECLLSVDMPIKTALEKVTRRDSLSAMKFFESRANRSKEKFNISVVHSFSLLQNCLKYSMHLNALLGSIYPDVNVAEFFSGSLAYNWYNDLKNHTNLNRHISDTFEDSPSVLQLFVSVSTKIQAMMKQKSKTVK